MGSSSNATFSLLRNNKILEEKASLASMKRYQNKSGTVSIFNYDLYINRLIPPTTLVPLTMSLNQKHSKYAARRTFQNLEKKMHIS